MIKLCTIDLDGTLFDKNKNVSKENREAIKLAKQNGCHIVISTGRPYPGIKHLVADLGLNEDGDFIICYNGSKIINTFTEDYIFVNTMTGKDVKELYRESKRLGVNFHAFRKNEELITDVYNPYTDVEMTINNIGCTLVNFEDIKDNDEFLKCMMVSSDENVTRVIDEINPIYPKKYSMVRSAKIFLEFLSPGIDKGSGLEILAKHYNINPNETMAIGDAGNDLAMIKKAHIGVAMANSFPNIKEVADYVTTSNEESGVAHAINKFINHL